MEKVDELKLFCVTHKRVDNIPSDRIVIGVGKQRDQVGADCTDGIGDNISNKNDNYCELTALYWIWKNDQSDYIGLEHYRRFFYTNCYFRPKILKKEKIKKILERGYVILPYRTSLEKSVYETYRIHHDIQDLDQCIDLINKDFPEYSDACKHIMSAQKMSIANMFVMPRKMLSEYCEWLFSILFSIENKIDLSQKDPYQKRVFGFLSERLFNIWLYHKKPKIFYSRVYTDAPPRIHTRIIQKLKSLFR